MLSDRLKQLRKEKGYSQEQIARKLNITQGVVSQWENGLTIPTSDRLPQIADIFGVTVDELMGHDAQPSEATQNQKILNNPLVKMLVSLTPEEAQRVYDFVAGMKAKRRD